MNIWQLSADCFLGKMQFTSCFPKSLGRTKHIQVPICTNLYQSVPTGTNRSPAPSRSNCEVLRAVSSSGLALEHANEKLRDDEEVVLRAVQGAGLALEFASERRGRSMSDQFKDLGILDDLR